jgi:hypothetical protein
MSDPVELELETAVSHHVGAGNPPKSSAREANNQNRQPSGRSDTAECLPPSVSWMLVASLD